MIQRWKVVQTYINPQVDDFYGSFDLQNINIGHNST
jgi:hypothetical protein